MTNAELGQIMAEYEYGTEHVGVLTVPTSANRLKFRVRVLDVRMVWDRTDVMVEDEFGNIAWVSKDRVTPYREA